MKTCEKVTFASVCNAIKMKFVQSMSGRKLFCELSKINSPGEKKQGIYDNLGERRVLVGLIAAYAPCNNKNLFKKYNKNDK